MKKIFLFFLMSMASFLVMNAQTSLLATLSHNGEISIFTGTKAFKQAYNASVDGDVITLSSGQFETVNIEKSLTIRGAGMWGANSTIISGNTNIGRNNKTVVTTIEGLTCNAQLYIYNSEATFLKCYFNYAHYSGSGNADKLKFIHCINTASVYVPGAFYIGCYISSQPGYNNTFDNCIIELESNYSYPATHSNFKNSIIIAESKQGNKNNYNTFNGCVYIGDTTDPFASNTYGEGNMAFPAGTEFLKEGTTTYELLDELKSTWIGTDGTQVGMHGGQLPFDPITTSPQFKKFDVSSKTSADGKLSVDIVVDSE